MLFSLYVTCIYNFIYHIQIETKAYIFAEQDWRISAKGEVNHGPSTTTQPQLTHLHRQNGISP